MITNLDTGDSVMRNVKQLWRKPEKQVELDSYYALPYLLFFLPTVVFCLAGIMACFYLRYSARIQNNV